MTFTNVERTGRLALLSACLLCCGTTAAFAEAYNNQLPPELAGMGVTEHLGSSIPLDLKFLDDRGQHVRLGDYFRPGRPVILSFNYSNCPMLCSLQLTGLVDGLKDVELTCGTDFEFVSVSIDPHELPLRAAQTRQRYYQQYGRQGTGSGWHFLVGSQKSVDQLAEAAGVAYRYLSDKREYVHPAVCIAVTPAGLMSRYLYGVTFVPQTLRLALVEASAGQIGTTVDQILLFCFHYDGTTGKYTIAARRVMALAGSVTVFLIGAYIGRQVVRERRSRSERPSDDQTLAQQDPVLLRVDEDGTAIARPSLSSSMKP